LFKEKYQYPQLVCAKTNGYLTAALINYGCILAHQNYPYKCTLRVKS